MSLTHVAKDDNAIPRCCLHPNGGCPSVGTGPRIKVNSTADSNSGTNNAIGTAEMGTDAWVGISPNTSKSAAVDEDAAVAAAKAVSGVMSPKADRQRFATSLAGWKAIGASHRPTPAAVRQRVLDHLQGVFSVLKTQRQARASAATIESTKEG